MPGLVVGKFTHACVFGGVDCKYVISGSTGKALDSGWLVGWSCVVVRVCYGEGALEGAHRLVLDVGF